VDFVIVCARFTGRLRVIATLVLLHAGSAAALPTGITGYAGNFGAGCDSCHNGGEAPVVRIEGPAEVAAGEQAMYRFVLESQSSLQAVAGFDVAASAGTLAPIVGQGARSEFGEVVHSAPKDTARSQAVWDFLWRAPQTSGPQTLYASGLSANGDGARSGDATAATTLVVTVAAPPCAGDCDGDREVTVSELVRGVRIALQTLAVEICDAFDRDGSGSVTVSELIAAVRSALDGCDAVRTATPTPTRVTTAAPTPTPGVCATATASPEGVAPLEWTTYGGSQERTFFNEHEKRISRATVGSLRPKWRYQTAAVVTSSPSVAYVDVPGEGRIKVVYATSWDGRVYALRAANGTRLWSYQMKPHPGASFPYSSSPAVVTVGDEALVYVGGGMTMYCLAAATGDLRWEFDAGTGCTDCDQRTERNEIESSPAVVDGLVVFGMDVNDSRPGKGGTYGVDAVSGTLVWYFDLETGATCRPDSGDEVRRFDGFHSAAELGLSEDFFATREGCDFDRSWTECGNVWSSFAVDAERRALYIASSNCDTDDNPETFPPPPPMPPYDEAIFALDFDGVPLWRWRPREVDDEDLSFGGVPNLFRTVIAGVEREVVGIGGKDGTYYVLDRDGINELTGEIEPYWQTKVVPGGAIGGIIASAAVGDGRVQFSTAIGLELANPQKPAAWGLRAEDGEVVWSNAAADPSYASTTAIPGVAFMGSLFAGRMIAYDSDTGEVLYRSPSLGGPIASAGAIVDGEIFIGAGVGQRGNPQGPAHLQSLIPSPITAFCLPDACDCPPTLCDDDDPCTYDYRNDEGACATEPAPDGIRCMIGEEEGVCAVGVCAL